MKLCIVTQTVSKGDGQGRVNYEVTWEAIRRGHQVTLLASHVAPDLQNHPLVQWVKISVSKFPTTLLRDIIFARRSISWLQKYRSTFDLVKVNGAISWWIETDVNAVHFVHSTWLKSNLNSSQESRKLYRFYHWLYSALNSRWEAIAFRKTKVLVAVSENVKQEIAHLGILEQSIQVISNGVDLAEFHPGVASRQALGLPDHVPLALFAGDIRLNRKNLDTVLHALVNVPNLHLAIVGALAGSPYPKLAAQLNVESRVHFLGYRQEMADIMKVADLFVLPSRYEPFGMVILEAMACGVPVITTATVGAAEVITSECGFVLADPNDVQNLVQVMHQLANNPEKCREMGKAARSVAEQHSWRSKASRYVELFEEFALANAVATEEYERKKTYKIVGA